MKVSRNTLQNSYNVNENYFFTDRTARNQYFDSHPSEAISGTYCAIGGDPTSTDYEADVWQLELFNGANWVLQTVDPNYSLVITEDGINAITRVAKDYANYHMEIKAIKIKQHNIVYTAKNIINWTKEDFESEGDIVLDTTTNANFTLLNNLSWRTNMANGGIQFIIRIDTNTYGEIGSRRVDEYNIGAVGLYVSDPDEPGRMVLFAIGNLNNIIPKYNTTATRVGNSVKLILNTVITNLGYVPDLTIAPDSSASIPEAADEIELVDKYGTFTSPYNLVLVNNYAGTNIPALAARRGDPTNYITWEYFTPRDDVIEVSDNQVDVSVKDYMVACWDSDQNKFVRAVGKNSSSSQTARNLTGIKVNNNIIFAGNVSAYNLVKYYTITPNNQGLGYSPNDTLHYTDASTNIDFIIKVVSVDDNGKVEGIQIVSISGYEPMDKQNCPFTQNPGSPEVTGTGFTADIVSANLSSNIYLWEFPEGWYNKPLYVDKNWPTSTAAEIAAWEAYCLDVGLDSTTESTDRRGKLTIKENDYFVGWCTGTKDKSSIKLAMDLDDEASDVDYGTTRYATNTEVKEKTSAVQNITSITPKTAFDNYLQRSKPTTGAGSTWNNRIGVDSFVQFNETIVGKGATATESIVGHSSDISFFGVAYRAKWGDLAEYYRSDKIYPSGTLITIGCGGGDAEITQAITECNGIISDKPGYELGEKKDIRDLPVALIGKVPVIFDKNCNPQFGDRIYLSSKEPGRASTIPYGKCLGKIIDKNKDLSQRSTILCSVKISF